MMPPWHRHSGKCASCVLPPRAPSSPSISIETPSFHYFDDDSPSYYSKDIISSVIEKALSKFTDKQAQLQRDCEANLTKSLSHFQANIPRYFSSSAQNISDDSSEEINFLPTSEYCQDTVPAKRSPSHSNDDEDETTEETVIYFSVPPDPVETSSDNTEESTDINDDFSESTTNLLFDIYSTKDFPPLPHISTASDDVTVVEKDAFKESNTNILFDIYSTKYFPPLPPLTTAIFIQRKNATSQLFFSTAQSVPHPHHGKYHTTREDASNEPNVADSEIFPNLSSNLKGSSIHYIRSNMANIVSSNNNRNNEISTKYTTFDFEYISNLDILSDSVHPHFSSRFLFFSSNPYYHQSLSQIHPNFFYHDRFLSCYGLLVLWIKGNIHHGFHHTDEQYETKTQLYPLFMRENNVENIKASYFSIEHKDDFLYIKHRMHLSGVEYCFIYGATGIVEASQQNIFAIAEFDTIEVCVISQIDPFKSFVLPFIETHSINEILSILSKMIDSISISLGLHRVSTNLRDMCNESVRNIRTNEKPENVSFTEPVQTQLSTTTATDTKILIVTSSTSDPVLAAPKTLKMICATLNQEIEFGGLINLENPSDTEIISLMTDLVLYHNIALADPGATDNPDFQTIVNSYPTLSIIKIVFFVKDFPITDDKNDETKEIVPGYSEVAFSAINSWTQEIYPGSDMPPTYHLKNDIHSLPKPRINEVKHDIISHSFDCATNKFVQNITCTYLRDTSTIVHTFMRDFSYENPLFLFQVTNISSSNIVSTTSIQDYSIYGLYDYDPHQVKPSSNQTTYTISTYSDTSIHRDFNLATCKKSHSSSQFPLLVFFPLSIFIHKYFPPGESIQALFDTMTPIVPNIIIESNDAPPGCIQQTNSSVFSLIPGTLIKIDPLWFTFINKYHDPVIIGDDDFLYKSKNCSVILSPSFNLHVPYNEGVDHQFQDIDNNPRGIHTQDAVLLLSFMQKVPRSVILLHRTSNNTHDGIFREKVDLLLLFCFTSSRCDQKDQDCPDVKQPTTQYGLLLISSLAPVLPTMHEIDIFTSYIWDSIKILYILLNGVHQTHLLILLSYKTTSNTSPKAIYPTHIHTCYKNDTANAREQYIILFNTTDDQETIKISFYKMMNSRLYCDNFLGYIYSKLFDFEFFTTQYPGYHLTIVIRLYEKGTMYDETTEKSNHDISSLYLFLSADSRPDISGESFTLAAFTIHKDISSLADVVPKAFIIITTTLLHIFLMLLVTNFRSIFNKSSPYDNFCLTEAILYHTTTRYRALTEWLHISVTRYYVEDLPSHHVISCHKKENIWLLYDLSSPHTYVLSSISNLQYFDIHIHAILGLTDIESFIHIDSYNVSIGINFHNHDLAQPLITYNKKYMNIPFHIQNIEIYLHTTPVGDPDHAYFAFKHDIFPVTFPLLLLQTVHEVVDLFHFADHDPLADFWFHSDTTVTPEPSLISLITHNGIPLFTDIEEFDFKPSVIQYRPLSAMLFLVDTFYGVESAPAYNTILPQRKMPYHDITMNLPTTLRSVYRSQFIKVNNFRQYLFSPEHTTTMQLWVTFMFLDKNKSSHHRKYHNFLEVGILCATWLAVSTIPKVNVPVISNPYPDSKPKPNPYPQNDKSELATQYFLTLWSVEIDPGPYSLSLPYPLGILRFLIRIYLHIPLYLGHILCGVHDIFPFLPSTIQFHRLAERGAIMTNIL